MKISATIQSSKGSHAVKVNSNDSAQELDINVKSDGFGSVVNGGEFLFLALATCFCNDLYREAKKKHIAISYIEVEASGDFVAEGKAGSNITYSAKVQGNASDNELDKLIEETDKVAEIHNTLREGVSVQLVKN